MSWGPLRFVDSLNVFPTSLASMIDDLRACTHKQLPELFSRPKGDFNFPDQVCHTTMNGGTKRRVFLTKRHTFLAKGQETGVAGRSRNMCVYIYIYIDIHIYLGISACCIYKSGHFGWLLPLNRLPPAQRQLHARSCSRGRPAAWATRVAQTFRPARRCLAKVSRSAGLGWWGGLGWGGVLLRPKVFR